MPLQSHKNLLSFFNSCFLQGLEVDQFFKDTPSDQIEQIRDELYQYLQTPELSIVDLGTESNQWFESEEDAKAWLASLLQKLPKSSHQQTPKDSNGTELSEGDSVTVIKDLKVKGGSSDLKRGTQIKNIHLVGDPEAIECRVNGSTLVLKTCFLKKTN